MVFSTGSLPTIACLPSFSIASTVASPVSSSLPSSPLAFQYPSHGPPLSSPITCTSSSPMPYFNPIILSPGNWNQSYGMEKVWLAEFHRLFNGYYPHVWILQPVDRSPVGGNNIRTYIDSAKVRFCCDNCGNGWTSMKGRVIFWFDFHCPFGIVAFKLFGQKCHHCNEDRYEDPMWYPEEILKVLGNAYNKIGQIHYGFPSAQIVKERRAGKPRTAHNSELCQACKDGLCTDRK